MKLSRVLILLSFMLLFTGWLQADVDPTHFFISLNLDGSDCFNGFVPGTGGTETCEESGPQGWAGAVITGSVNPGCPEEGCPTDDSVQVFCSGDEGCVAGSDPSGSTRLGGKSDPITQDFVVPVDGFGGGATDFQNTLGVPITTLVLNFHFDINPPDGTFFTCNGGDAFDACGITIDSGDLDGSMTFSGGHILSTPGTVHLDTARTAALAIVGRRARRRA